MELSWSLHYCLACDKQTQGEAYCSQSCRLADLETSSTWSAPISPTAPNSSQSSTNSGFYLSPAINFAAYKTATTGTASASTPNYNRSPMSPYFPGHTPSHTTNSKTVTPSTSQSSLGPVKGTSPPINQLSEQARLELLGYTNSFDNIRNWRRRTTWS